MRGLISKNAAKAMSTSPNLTEAHLFLEQVEQKRTHHIERLFLNRYISFGPMCTEHALWLVGCNPVFTNFPHSSPTNIQLHAPNRVSCIYKNYRFYKKDNPRYSQHCYSYNKVDAFMGQAKQLLTGCGSCRKWLNRLLENCHI